MAVKKKMEVPNKKNDSMRQQPTGYAKSATKGSIMKQSYRVDEVAERLNTSDRTVRRILTRGDLEGFKVGATWRVKHETLTEYEKKRDKSASE